MTQLVPFYFVNPVIKTYRWIVRLCMISGLYERDLLSRICIIIIYIWRLITIINILLSLYILLSLINIVYTDLLISFLDYYNLE